MFHSLFRSGAQINEGIDFDLPMPTTSDQFGLPRLSLNGTDASVLMHHHSGGIRRPSHPLLNPSTNFQQHQPTPTKQNQNQPTPQQQPDAVSSNLASSQYQTQSQIDKQQRSDSRQSLMGKRTHALYVLQHLTCLCMELILILCLKSFYY